MPLYPFKRPNGKTIDVHFSMREAPAIGTTIEHEGETLVRIASGAAIVPDDMPFASNALPRWMAGCQHDRMGRPIVTSRAHGREICSANNLVKQ